MRALAGQLAERGGDLCHEVGHLHRYAVGFKGAAFLFHDVHLYGGCGRVVRADLRAEAVFERGDDAASVGVILRVGRCHQQHIYGQADAIAAYLNIPLFQHIQQPHLNSFGEVGQLVHGEDASVGAGHEAVVHGELV